MMSPLLKQAVKEHEGDSCPSCGASFKMNIGTASLQEGRFTMWACCECDRIFHSTPRCCITGCGLIDTHCKCKYSVVGSPRLEV